MARKVIKTDGAPAALAAYSQAIVASGQFVFAAGQLGLDPATGQLAEGIEKQAERALLNLKAVLEAAGSGLENAVKVTVFLRDINDFSKLNEVYVKFFSKDPPARTTFGGNDLPRGADVEIECIAVIPD